MRYRGLIYSIYIVVQEAFMSVYNEKVGIGKLGVNLLRSITDENQCYFHEILQENDVGIDAFIEFTRDGQNDGRCIAVQIKTGNSFFNVDKSVCKIPIGGHYKYWKNHSLQVYGIVCDYDQKVAFWVSITDFISQNDEDIKSGKIHNITFPVMEINRLTSSTFGTIFKPLVYGNLPQLSLEEALRLSRSDFLIEKELSVTLLLNTYADQKQSWDRCLCMFNEETNEDLLKRIVYYFSYVSYNPDLWGRLEYSVKTKEYIKSRIQSFDKNLIIKMLSLTEDGIERGKTGQCVESLISIIPHNKKLLIEIIESFNSHYIGLNALMILSYYDPQFVAERANHYVSICGENAKVIVDFIKRFNGFDLYI